MAGDAGRVQIVEVDARSGGAQMAMQAYFDELDRRFPGGFEPGDALTTGADEMRPPDGVFLLALVPGAVVGCGGLRRLEDGIGEIKRMWVHPDERGRRVGSRLLAGLEDCARARRFVVIRLDTNSHLPEAVALYRSAGYREIEAYNDTPDPDHWFEKPLEDQSA